MSISNEYKRFVVRQVQECFNVYIGTAVANDSNPSLSEQNTAIMDLLEDSINFNQVVNSDEFNEYFETLLES